MSTYRQIQIALGTILLWSSTSVSSFAYTNTITPGKFQSDTVKLPIERIPVRSLNLTPNTNLIAGEIRDDFSKIPKVSIMFSKWDDMWKIPTDRPKRLLDYCNTQKDFPVQPCYSFLTGWLLDGMDNFRSQNDFTDMDNILAAIKKTRHNQ